MAYDEMAKALREYAETEEAKRFNDDGNPRVIDYWTERTGNVVRGFVEYNQPIKKIFSEEL